MKKISLAIFDLLGTTVWNDNASTKFLHEASCHFGLRTSVADFENSGGTNKIRLYEFLIARDRGEDVQIENLDQYRFLRYYEHALEIFRRYSKLMISHYQTEAKAIPGAEETFRWCHDNDIRVVTDSGFHMAVNDAILDTLQWRERGLIDFALNLEDTGEIEKPAPFMIFKAMLLTEVQNVHEVIKIGDSPADLLSGYHAGCKGNIGVLTGGNSAEILRIYPHTHLINSVTDLPKLILREFNGSPYKLRIV
jgi:phosphonatase-like hydrolase